jgi:peptide/nickel transport system substrate-binding protein
MAEDRGWLSSGPARRFGRRSMLIAGGGAAFLAACGGGEKEKKPETKATTAPGASPAAGAATAAPAQPKVGGTLRSPLVGLSSANPPTIDPYKNLTYLAQIPAGHHYSRLLKLVPQQDSLDFSTTEGDAARANPEQPDNRTYIFKLRDNIKFHNVAPLNGRKLTAEDVLYTAERFAKEGANRGSWNNTVDKVEAVDPQTFKITLKAPNAWFLGLSASPEHLWIIPKETVDQELTEKQPVGSGPFIFESLTPSVSIKWRRNPDFYDTGRPYVNGVEASLVGDPSTIIANLKSGQFDHSLLDSAIFESVKKDVPALTFDLTGDQVIGGFLFNFDIKPWNDMRVRQALSMAYDRDGTAKAVDQTGKVRYFSAISELAPWYLDPRDPKFGPNGKYFKRDIGEAKKLLAAAGYPNGLSFPLRANIDRYGSVYKQRWEIAQATIKEAGFNANLVFEEYGQYIQTTFLGKFNEGIAIGPLQVPLDPDSIFFTLYHPESLRHNWSGEGEGSLAKDAQLVKMFNDQRSELDRNKRLALIQDIQRYMAEKMYLVPHIGTTSVHGFQPWLKFARTPGYIRTFGIAGDALPYWWIDK